MNLVLVSGDVSGRVVDALGAGVSARVGLERWPDVAWRSKPFGVAGVDVGTNIDGAFEIAELAGGRYRIVAYDSEHRLATAASEIFQVTENSRVELPPISLVASPPLRVTVRGINGAEVAGMLHVDAPKGAPELVRSLETLIAVGTSGVRVSGLHPGEVRLRFEAGEKGFAPAEAIAKLSADGSETNLELVPLRTMEAAPEKTSFERWMTNGAWTSDPTTQRLYGVEVLPLAR